MKIIQLLGQLSRLTKISNFEYFVFKTNGDRITTDFTPEETAQIFEVICTLPFPLNTNPLNAKKIRRLMANVKFDLHSDEKRAIEAVLKEISADLFVLPVPKSLAQFYCALALFAVLAKNQEDAPLESQEIEPHQKRFYEIISQFFLDSLQAIYGTDYEKQLRFGDRSVILDAIRVHGYTTKAALFIAANQKFAAVWAGLNAALVTETINADTEDLQQYYRSLAYKLCERYKLEDTPKFRCLDESDSNNLLSLFNLEIDIMFDPTLFNSIALYRGTKNGYLGDIETSEIAADPKGISWSFGNGLLESSLFPTGDCALLHILRPAPGRHLKQQNPATGYIVFVDKTRYLNNDAERGLFWIPPYIMLARICARGELFHPRTAGGLGKGNSRMVGHLKSCIQVNAGVNKLDSKSMMSIYMFKLLTAEDIDLNKLINKYLKQNARNLTPTENGYVLERKKAVDKEAIPFSRRIYNFLINIFKRCINFFKSIFNYFRTPFQQTAAAPIIPTTKETKQYFRQLMTARSTNPALLLSDASRQVRSRAKSYPITEKEQLERTGASPIIDIFAARGKLGMV